MTRQINPKIIVLCEGKNEKDYIDTLKNKYKIYGLYPKIAKHRDGKGIITEARKIVEKEFDFTKDKNDCMLCVFDVENNRKNWEVICKDIKKFENRNKNQLVLFSNPCFEVWLLLCVKEFTSRKECFELKKECRNHNLDFLNKDKIFLAIKRAKKLEQFHKSENRDLFDFESNPLTKFYVLFEKINFYNRN